MKNNREIVRKRWEAEDDAMGEALENTDENQACLFGYDIIIVRLIALTGDCGCFLLFNY